MRERGKLYKEQTMSMTELSKRSGVSYQLLEHYANKHTKLSKMPIDMLLRLSNTTNIPVVELYNKIKDYLEYDN